VLRLLHYHHQLVWHWNSIVATCVILEGAFDGVVLIQNVHWRAVPHVHHLSVHQPYVWSQFSDRCSRRHHFKQRRDHWCQ
jgi:hypothetical protein